MCGGFLWGLYMKCSDFFEDFNVLFGVLILIVGVGYLINIDGIGGGMVVIIKVVMLFKFEDGWVDVDYFFV